MTMVMGRDAACYVSTQGNRVNKGGGELDSSPPAVLRALAIDDASAERVTEIGHDIKLLVWKAAGSGP